MSVSEHISKAAPDNTPLYYLINALHSRRQLFLIQELLEKDTPDSNGIYSSLRDKISWRKPDSNSEIPCYGRNFL